MSHVSVLVPIHGPLSAVESSLVALKRCGFWSCPTLVFKSPVLNVAMSSDVPLKCCIVQSCLSSVIVSSHCCRSVQSCSSFPLSCVIIGASRLFFVPTCPGEPCVASSTSPVLPLLSLPPPLLDAVTWCPAASSDALTRPGALWREERVRSLTVVPHRLPSCCFSCCCC